MAKMGFEKYKRVVKTMNNQRVTATFGDRKFYFRSKLEYHWALCLELLKKSGNISAWDYECDLFIFEGEITAPIQYRPDFKIYDNDGGFYFQETKGYHDGQTNTKLRRMAKHFPDVEIELVLQNIPKSGSKGVSRRRIAGKYARRIIDASEIFKQTGIGKKRT